METVYDRKPVGMESDCITFNKKILKESSRKRKIIVPISIEAFDTASKLEHLQKRMDGKTYSKELPYSRIEQTYLYVLVI